MAVNSLDYVDKVLSNREATSSDKRLIEEFGAKTLTVSGDDVWGAEIDTDPAVELAKPSPSIAQFTLSNLTSDPTVPSNQAWRTNILDWVPPAFGAGYEAQFFDGSNNPIGIPEQINRNFRFAYKTGILTLDDASGITFPIKISGYRYTGPTILDVASGITSDPVYVCPPSVSVGDAVFFVNDETVDRAMAGIIGQTAPAVGIVKSKPTATSATLAQTSELSGYSGLVRGDPYYVSNTVPGALVTPSPDAAGEYSQQVGTAVSPTKLLVSISVAVRL